MIEIKNLSRRYGDVVAVDNVSFHIGKGEVVGLLGHNGAGKTTIMKMMTGFVEPTSGSIHIDGLDVNQSTRQVQSRIGYLPENCPVWPEMTVVDYLDHQATLHGLADDEKPKAIREAVRRTALLEKVTQPIHTLSRGYRQRVGVAQAILHHPKIVILDEPTNGLDPTQIRQMRDLIADLAQSATVIVSTHILHEVQAVCARVLILRAGALVVDARLDALQKEQKLLVTIDQKAVKLLEEIQGVQGVQAAGEGTGRYSYVVNASMETAPVIAAHLARADVRLFMLKPEIRDLEAVFAEANEMGRAMGGQP